MYSSTALTVQLKTPYYTPKQDFHLVFHSIQLNSTVHLRNTLPFDGATSGKVKIKLKMPMPTDFIFYGLWDSMREEGTDSSWNEFITVRLTAADSASLQSESFCYRTNSCLVDNHDEK